MTQAQCHGCEHQNKCEDLYRHMGSSTAPPVSLKIIQAFIIPMLLFVLTLATVQWFLHNRVAPSLIPFLGTVAAVGVILMYAMISKRLMTVKTQRTRNT